jgi:hypothetical protein
MFIDRHGCYNLAPKPAKESCGNSIQVRGWVVFKVGNQLRFVATNTLKKISRQPAPVLNCQAVSIHPDRAAAGFHFSQ